MYTFMLSKNKGTYK